MQRNIKEMGADASGKTLCTEIFAKAAALCAQEGGGTIFVPAGRYLTASIQLYSHTELHLEAGSVLLFADDEELYPVVRSRWEGVERQVRASCIYADGAHNIAITGRGTLNGQGARWWRLFKEDKLAYPRPKLISLDNCRDILIKDVFLTDSPSWTVNPINCDNIAVRGISIKNPADSPNTDGINPESCRNVHISDCHIDVGDDCITIKSGVEETPQRIACENIVITNCTMANGHGGVVIGSEMSGGVHNVVISNCIFDGTDRGIRIKSRRGRGGIVEDIRIFGIIMREVICPIVLNLYYFCGPRGKDEYVWSKKAYPVGAATPCFRRLSFSNITARNAHAAAGFIYGLAEQFIDNIEFKDIEIEMAPEAEAGRPAMMGGLEPMRKRGFYCGNLQNARFENVRLLGVEGPAFAFENARNIGLLRCRQEAPLSANAIETAGETEKISIEN